MLELGLVRLLVGILLVGRLLVGLLLVALLAVLGTGGAARSGGKGWAANMPNAPNRGKVS